MTEGTPTIGLVTSCLENFEDLTKARQHTAIKYALHYLNEYQKEKKYYDIVMEAGKKSVFGTIEKLAEAAEKTLRPADWVERCPDFHADKDGNMVPDWETD